MDDRDLAFHRTLTRVHAKFEALDVAQAEAVAALDMARLRREGTLRWDDDELPGKRTAHR